MGITSSVMGVSLGPTIGRPQSKWPVPPGKCGWSESTKEVNPEVASHLKWLISWSTIPPTLVTLWKAVWDRVMAIIRDLPAASTSLNPETKRRENIQTYMGGVKTWVLAGWAADLLLLRKSGLAGIWLSVSLLRFLLQRTRALLNWVGSSRPKSNSMESLGMCMWEGREAYNIK